MQHAVSLGDFVDAGCCADDGVYQDRASTDANLAFHLKVPLLAFPGLVHFRVVLTSAVLLSYLTFEQFARPTRTDVP